VPTGLGENGFLTNPCGAWEAGIIGEKGARSPDFARRLPVIAGGNSDLHGRAFSASE
jgi:hypothetical protein